MNLNPKYYNNRLFERLGWNIDNAILSLMNLNRAFIEMDKNEVKYTYDRLHKINIRATPKIKAAFSEFPESYDTEEDCNKIKSTLEKLLKIFKLKYENEEPRTPHNANQITRRNRNRGFLPESPSKIREREEKNRKRIEMAKSVMVTEEQYQNHQRKMRESNNYWQRIREERRRENALKQMASDKLAQSEAYKRMKNYWTNKLKPPTSGSSSEGGRSRRRRTKRHRSKRVTRRR